MSVNAFSDAFAILALAILFIAGVLLLAVASRSWVRALSETENYRSLRMRVDAQAETLRDAEAAVAELQGHARRNREGDDTIVPSEEELLAWTRAQSEPEYGGEPPMGAMDYETPPEPEYRTTDDNAMRVPRNGEAGEIDPDHLFAPGAEL